MPDGLTLLRAEVTSGEGEVTTERNTMNATIASLAPGQATTITVTARVSRDASGTVRNVATASTDVAGRRYRGRFRQRLGQGQGHRRHECG